MAQQKGIAPDFELFNTHFNASRTQLVYKWIPADLETPVATYMKLCAVEDYAFLLESVEGGAVLGRYSAIGLKPDRLIKYENGQCTYLDTGHDTGKDDWTAFEDTTLDVLKQEVENSRLDQVEDELPPMISSGLFGHMGYDMVRLVENIPDNNPDSLNIPDALLMRPTIMVLFDNVKQMMCIATPVRDHHGSTDKSAEEIYNLACAKISEIIEKISGPLDRAPYQKDTQLSAPLPRSSNMTKEEYEQAVQKGIEYIYAGDIFQFVPSQRFSVPFDLHPVALYRSLRRLNPSPFLFLLHCKTYSLVGSSPEIMVRVRKGDITIRPIAGTRPRGKNAAEDKAYAQDLLADPKERAEHLMLLDLGRNDVGRTAQIGSVEVTEEFCIENYSHVMHIVSNVQGKLRDDLHSLDALFSGFPAGTVSGAPKIRAMEIIDELEPERRSFYGGCIGYLDGNGDVDTCIALRTALLQDGKLYIQAGAGVVADSVPEKEYEETCNKARALIAAAEDAIARAR